jgi:hypothetical protein
MIRGEIFQIGLLREDYEKLSCDRVE